MKNLDKSIPHLRFVTYKTITDTNNIQHIERTFVLVPVKAKSKTKLTKEQVSNKKANKVYVAMGISDKIPYDDTIEDNSKYWDKLKLGKQVITDYRTWKKKFDEETTEVITLSNGFKQKIKIKLDFIPLPSMKLSPVERNTRMDEHKKSSKAKRDIKNSRVKDFRANSKPYVYEGYTSTTKDRKDRQEALKKAHNDVINKLIDKLRSKGKKNDYTISPTEKGNIEPNGIYKTMYKPKIKFNGTKRNAIAEACKIANTAGNSGAQLDGKDINLFTSNLQAA